LAAIYEFLDWLFHIRIAWIPAGETAWNARCVIGNGIVYLAGTQGPALGKQALSHLSHSATWDILLCRKGICDTWTQLRISSLS
jgi:hypothetical protein